MKNQVAREGDSPIPKRKRKARGRWVISTLLLWLSAAALGAGAQPVQVHVELSADEEAVALQFDVMPRSGSVTFSSVQFTGASAHVVESAVVSSGATRYVVYSTTGQPISPSGKIQANFSSSAPLRDGMVEIHNVMASNAGGIEVPAQPTSLPLLVSDPPLHRSAETSVSFPLRAPAVDLDGSISSIRYFVDDSLIGTGESFPFAIQFTPPSSGLFELTAQATDNSGKSMLFNLGGLRAYRSDEVGDFASFSEIHFGSGALPSFASDPLSIGTPNGIAYFLGINPHNVDISRLPTLTIENNPDEMVYRFLRLSSANDVTWNVIESEDLAEWSNVPPSTLTETDIGAGFHEVEVRLPLGTTPSSTKFLNLKVSQP